MSESLKRILYVEDEPDIRTIAELALTQIGGFTLKVCGTGRQAVDCAPEFAPDLILLDVMMPGMDGPETLACLRDLPATADTPVIFMTAKAQRHETAQYLSLGAIGVIPKPFDPLELSETIQEIWQSGLESGNARHAG